MSSLLVAVPMAQILLRIYIGAYSHWQRKPRWQDIQQKELPNVK